MVSSRSIRLIGLAATVAGTLLSVDGPQSLAALFHWLFSYAGVILLVIAAIGLVRNIAPRGSVTGPLLLGAIGLAVVMFREGWWPAAGAWSATGVGLAVAGGLMVMQPEKPPLRSSPVRRTVGALFNREITYSQGQDAPELLSIVAIGCRFRVRLASAGQPTYGLVEINVVSLLGHVEFSLPRGWPVVAGRVSNTHGVRLSGLLDSTETFDDPRDPEQAGDLDELVARRKKAVRTRQTGVPVVVHIVGWGGSVTILDRPD